MAVYALSQRNKETYDAAGKAIRDVYSVLGEFGSRLIWSMPKNCSKFLKVLDLPYLVLFLLCAAGKKDSIFYSIPENGIKIKLIKKIQKIKKYQIVCFVNDINAFRYGAFDSPEVQQRMASEIELIACADLVIAPNKNTEKLFREHGVQSQIVTTGVWDYLMDDVAERKSQTEDNKIKIAFAGNLNKSEFLWKLQEMPGISYELWGKLDADKAPLPTCCNYHGVLPADEVPRAIATCDYGLVWDGTGADVIEGGLGEYLRYNNSHKCGLYLAAGLPAIVWDESGMSDFIKKNECGLCIHGLSELESAVKNCDYEKVQKCVDKVGTNIRKGEYLRKAFRMIDTENGK